MVDVKNCNNNHNEFKFKFISENEFSSIVKHVQRARRKKEEEKDWENYLEQKNKKERNKQESVSSVIDSHSCTKENRLNVSGPYLTEKVDSLRATGTKNKVKKGRSEAFEKQTCSDRVFPVIPSTELQRIGELQTRLKFALGQILKLSDLSNTYDSDQDVSRLRQRGTEFMARFTRNYLYQIKRQVEVIKKYVLNPESVPNHISCQKIISSYQLGIQALQAFEKNISFCLIDGVPNQVMEFLSLVCELSNTVGLFLCNDFKNEDDELENMCLTAMTHLSDIGKINTSRPSTTKGRSNINTKSVTNKPKKHDSLWMYESDSKAVWKKKSAALARIKFGPPKQITNSKRQDKSSVCKKPKPSVKPNEDRTKAATIKNEVKPVSKQNEGRRKTNRNNHLKEDQIKTMMEIIPFEITNEEAEDIQKNSTGHENHEHLLIKSINGMTNSFNTAISGLQELLHSVKKVTEIEENSQCNGAIFSSKANKKEKRNNNENDNVRMIIMKAYDSDIIKDKQPIKSVHSIPKKLSEKDRYTALDYRHLFMEYKKECFYYQCPNKDKPWDVISRISDSIVNWIIREIAKELDANTILNSVFDSKKC